MLSSKDTGWLHFLKRLLLRWSGCGGGAAAFEETDESLAEVVIHSRDSGVLQEATDLQTGGKGVAIREEDGAGDVVFHALEAQEAGLQSRTEVEVMFDFLGIEITGQFVQILLRAGEHVLHPVAGAAGRIGQDAGNIPYP